jgi:L-alanine-DL-glutamate epimerase-like enolase superfamily enzyme
VKAPLKIAEATAELWRYRAPAPITPSGIMSADVVVTTLRLADGVVGTGFSVTLGSEDAEALAAARHVLERFVAGTFVRHPLAIGREIGAALGRPSEPLRTALASIDVALWDLYALTLGVPIGVAMGGSARRVPVYGSGSFKRGGDPEEAVETALTYMRRGARGVKLRAAGNASDRSVIEAVARRLDGKIDVMIDANSRCTLSSAAELLRVAADVNARFVEEPLPADDLAGYAALAQSAPAPIATGENLRGSAEAAPYLTGHWCSVIQPDLTVMGGLTECLRTAQLAEHVGIETAPHFLPALFIQLAAVVPNLTWLEDFPTVEPLFGRIPVMDPDGYMTLPDLPGHGLVFADGARAAFRIA